MGDGRRRQKEKARKSRVAVEERKASYSVKLYVISDKNMIGRVDNPETI